MDRSRSRALVALTMAVIAAAAFATADQGDAYDDAYVNASSLNIRARPDSKAVVVGVLHFGDQVRVRKGSETSASGHEWVAVERGYVVKAFLSDTPPSPRVEKEPRSRRVASATTKAGYAACRTEGWLDDMVRFAGQHDMFSYGSYMESGRCIQLEDGWAVTVIDRGWLGVTQFILRGEKFWTVSEGIQ